MIIDIITSVSSIGALIISVFAIKYAIKGSDKQLLTNKYEEIYSIILTLSYHYSSLKFLYHQLENYHNEEKFDSEQRQKFYNEFKKQVENYKKRINIEHLYDSTARLKVLANSYMTNKNLKLKILAYNDLFEKLMTVSIQGQMMYKEMFYKEGFPEEMNLMKFIEEIESEIIKLMDFGGNSISRENISQYREKKFKKELKIKSV